MREKAETKNGRMVVALLFLFMVINFADKIVVGLAGVSIMADLGLTPRQFGLLGSAFFYLFSVSAIAVGFLTNFVPTKWILLGLALVWSAVQFPMVTEVSFTTLMVCRIILGAGEGPAFGTAMHALYKWFPDEKRTLPTAILTQGSAFCRTWIERGSPMPGLSFGSTVRRETSREQRRQARATYDSACLSRRVP